MEPATARASSDESARLRAGLLSLVVAIALLGVKYFAYRLTGSSAVLSDALESITNVVAAMFALGGLVFAGRPADRGHPYGHGKIEYFSAVFEGGLIAFAAVLILWQAFLSLRAGHVVHEVGLGIAITVAAGAVNAALGWYLVTTGRRVRSITLVADGKHVLSDFWTSLGVFIGLLLVHLTGIAWLDPLAAAAVGVNLAVTGVRLVRQAAGGLLDEEDSALLALLVQRLRSQPAPGDHPAAPPARPARRPLHPRRRAPHRSRVLDGGAGARGHRRVRRAGPRRLHRRGRDHLPHRSLPARAVCDLRRRGLSRAGRAVPRPAAAHAERGHLDRRGLLARRAPPSCPAALRIPGRLLTAVTRLMDARTMGRVIARLERDAPSWDTTALAAVARESGRDPFRVLVGCLLSLRTKDETTGPASARLFALADTPERLLALPLRTIERAIYPVGFYRTKARVLHRVCRDLIERFDGRVPSDLDALLTLHGVGRKTANLVVTFAFGLPGICVDTHVHRITNRLGFVRTRTPDETERALRRRLPRRYWIGLNDLLVSFGQNLCRPTSPHCSRCPVRAPCARIGVRRAR